MFKALRAWLGRACLISITVLTSGYFCLSLPHGPHNAPVLWLPSGLSVLLLLLLGIRFWPVLAGYWWVAYFFEVIPRYLNHLEFNQQLTLSILLATASTVQMYLIAHYLRKLGGFSLLKSSANSCKFFLMVLAVGSIKAVIAFTGGILLIGASSPEWQKFMLWWLLGINSVYLIVPFGLILHDNLKSYKRLLDREYVSIVTLLIFLCACMFAPAFEPYNHYSVAYIFIPFLVWSALRFGHAGFSLIAAIVLIFELVSLPYHAGLFAEASATTTFYATQIFLGVYTSMGYLLASIVDERLRFEQELKNTAAELVPDIVSQIDTEGRFLSLNPAFEKVLGWKRSEWIGKECFQLFHEEDRIELIRASKCLIEKQSSTLQLHLRTRTKTGEFIELEVRGSPHYKGDKITSFFGVSRDITEKILAEKKLKHYTSELEIAHKSLESSNSDLEKRILAHTHQLIETNKALLASNHQLEQFAYVASHDLQEPIRMISLYLQLIKSQCKDKLDSETNKYIDYILSSSKRMQELVRDILIYSRIDTRLEAKKDLDTRLAVEEAKDNLKNIIDESRATLSYENLPKIYCEKTPLSQVFQNLIENSIKFKAEAQPIITVKAKEEERDWIFSVSDNGLGIEPQFHSKVFDMFYRLHSREHSPGTGIGLAVCKKIISVMGGEIWVDSDGTSGSTFSFTIPKMKINKSFDDTNNLLTLREI